MNDISNLFDEWPTTKDLKMVDLENLDHRYRVKVEDQTVAARKWFNSLSVQVLPYTVHDKDYLGNIMQHILSIIEHPNQRSNSDERKRQMSSDMELALTLIKSLPSSSVLKSTTQQLQQIKHTPNTAFIMMMMDPSRPELDDVCHAIKEVCSSFGIDAVRADDVEHQDKITDIVLQRISSSEFLIADVTGERPNVYYEIGYAHALNKRPILYRRLGTKLHFDLSVHNIPEYKNITELKEQLKKRFEAILGRQAVD